MQGIAATGQAAWLHGHGGEDVEDEDTCNDTSAIHVVVIGSQAACLDSVNWPEGGPRCPAGLVNTVPGKDVEMLRGSFIQITWEVVDWVFHNSDRVGNAGARHFSHLLGHYLGVLNTEEG